MTPQVLLAIVMLLLSACSDPPDGRAEMMVCDTSGRAYVARWDTTPARYVMSAPLSDSESLAVCGFRKTQKATSQ